jgi:hypothetical protein
MIFGGQLDLRAAETGCEGLRKRELFEAASMVTERDENKRVQAMKRG